SLRPSSSSRRAARALMPTSRTPDAAPVATRAAARPGTDVASPGSRIAAANAAAPAATARGPYRSTAGPATTSIAGIEPTLTKSSARPSAPFEAPVARCTLGRTAAHAPQKRPRTTNPAPVAIRLLRTGRCYERRLVSARMADPELSVVVTVLNEAGSVDELYRRAVAALDGRTFELVFVDDGSTDGTFAALARLHTA